MYKVLFPLVSEELIPSPHYDNSIAELKKRRRRDLDEMETYLRLELRREVRRRLEQKSLQLPHPLENLIEMVESAQTDAFQSLRHRQQGTQPLDLHGLDANEQPFNFAQQSPTTYGCGLEAPLEAPTLTAMTEGTHGGLSTSTSGDIFEPIVPSSSLQYDLDSSVGDPNEFCLADFELSLHSRGR
ncbi:hypothetical protein K4K54_004874, partial [Colletotrichum sp. SAR 10_86]